MTNEEKSFVEARELRLDEWLKIVVVPSKSREVNIYPDYCFPSEKHRDEYLAGISGRSRNDVNSLLRAFLLPTGYLGGDVDRITEFLKRDLEAALQIEQVRRVIRGEPAWEGLTWVLDLLHRPRLAINVINAYLAAHFWWMPDWRISGLCDAMTLIRAAYLESVHPRDELLSIAPRDFELVIGLLFERLKFEVCVTQRSHDSGCDIKLHRATAGTTESSVVECKRYTKNVGVKELRALLGVVERDGATRGLLVTTAGFTRCARAEASETNRIELIDFDALCILFNEHFGPEWPSRIDSIILEAQRQLECKMHD